MASLKITRASGDESIHLITPAIEYAFEQNFKSGFHKRMRDEERTSDIYWLSWKCLDVAAKNGSGEAIKPFGEAFLETLAKVEVIEDINPNG